MGRPRPLPDIFNATAKEYSDYEETRILTEVMQHTDTATHNGDKYNQVQEFIVGTANPLYVLYELPPGSNGDVELVKRFFQSNNDAADLLILWDYDVTGATKTALTAFNSNNTFRGVKDAQFDVSVLNPTTLNATTGVRTVTGPATIVSDGIIREPSSIPSTGVGANKAGGISPEVGSRIYKPGTGYLVKITSAADGNKITLGYTWLEDGD